MIEYRVGVELGTSDPQGLVEENVIIEKVVVKRSECR